MKVVHDVVADEEAGRRALAVVRLCESVLDLLHTALRLSQMTQADLASRLGIRRSAVNQVFKGRGNVHVATLAEYFYAQGYELELRISPIGRPREDAVRRMRRRWLPTGDATSNAARHLVEVAWEPSESHRGFTGRRA